MNENIDLAKILKDCPRGTKLYSKVHGEVEFAYIVEKSNKPIVVIATQKDNNETYYKDFTANGCLYSAYEVDECLLVPSKEQQDWSKFSAPWYKQDKDDERLRKTTIAFLKDFAEQGYENAIECIDWLESKGEQIPSPKFKVGDKIVNSFRKYIRALSSEGIISKITDDKYIFTDGSYIFISDQDSWELVQDRFDPKTLKPFDRVIVRKAYVLYWSCDLFSYNYIDFNGDNKSVCIGDNYSYCIPYNDETKHLVGTTNEAPEYYRYWED